VLQYKEYHGTNKKDQRLEETKGKWVPSRSASAFFNPSKYSTRRLEESEASVVDQIVKDVPPKEEEHEHWLLVKPMG
jgi:hypothetical protein